jgi:hypothetical protein
MPFPLLFSGENHFSGSGIDSSKLGEDPGVPVETSSEVEGATKVENNRSPTYRCKKCRRIVALQEHVIDHIPGEGETSFGWNKRKSGNPFNKSNESECSSIFIEPLRWMKDGKKTLNYNIKMCIFTTSFGFDLTMLICPKCSHCFVWRVIFYNILKCVLPIFSWSTNRCFNCLHCLSSLLYLYKVLW